MTRTGEGGGARSKDSRGGEVNQVEEKKKRMSFEGEMRKRGKLGE